MRRYSDLCHLCRIYGAFEGFRDEIASNTSDASMTIELNWSVGEGRLSIGGRMKSLVVNTELKYELKRDALICGSTTGWEL